MFCYGLRARSLHRDDLKDWAAIVRKERVKSSQAGHTARPAKIPPRPTFDNTTLGNKVSYNLLMIDVAEMTFKEAIDIKYE